MLYEYINGKTKFTPNSFCMGFNAKKERRIYPTTALTATSINISLFGFVQVKVKIILLNNVYT